MAMSGSLIFREILHYGGFIFPISCTGRNGSRAYRMQAVRRALDSAGRVLEGCSRRGGVVVHSAVGTRSTR